MSRRWAVAAVLLAAAGASGWVLHILDSDDPAAASWRVPGEPDAYMERFVTVEMDDAGKPKRRLEADHMAFHPDETTELSNPYYVLYLAEGEPWHVRSERGRVSADGDVVLLLGRVDIWRNDGSGARDLDVRTEDLKVLPESGYGETGKPATIRTPTSTSKGVGMRAWLDERRIELLSEVRTHVDGRRPAHQERTPGGDLARRRAPPGKRRARSCALDRP